MFNNLPGRVINLTNSQIPCEFCNGDYSVTMSEMVKSGKASDGLKLQYHKGDDFECGNKATVRVQGETDSFGAEYFHFCSDCHVLDQEIQKYQREQSADEPYDCDWCKKEVPFKDIRTTRDVDEGSNGPVYEVCSTCYKKQVEQIHEESNDFD